MNGSPSSVLTLGFGNGTFAGSPSLCLTLGYGVGEAVSANITQWSPIHYRSPNRRIDHRSPNKIIQLNKKS